MERYRDGETDRERFRQREREMNIWRNETERQ